MRVWNTTERTIGKKIRGVNMSYKESLGSVVSRYNFVNIIYNVIRQFIIL